MDTEGESDAQHLGLRHLILGAPLSDREHDHTVASVRAHLEGVRELLPRVYGTTPASTQAVAELKHIANLEEGAAELACMRAALLFAMHRELEVKRHFIEQETDADEAAFARDMSNRVLPFLVPRFFKHSCQAPEAFVTACLVMNEMWVGEQLGNWPRTTMPPDGS